MSKIVLVTGSGGFLGRVIQEYAQSNDQYMFVFVGRSNADLTQYKATEWLFKRVKPWCVVHLAAKVCGLYGHLKDGDAIGKTNTLIDENVLKAAKEVNVEKFISILSTCVFSDDAKQPLKAGDIVIGDPHDSNRHYAQAKRQLYSRTHDRNKPLFATTISLIPSNLYGVDYYKTKHHVESMHVIDALLYKYSHWKPKDVFEVEGSGNAIRQFLHVRDFATIILHVVYNINESNDYVISPPEDHALSINDVLDLMVEHGHLTKESITYLHTEEGQHSKISDDSDTTAIFKKPFPFIPFEQGFKEMLDELHLYR